MALPFALDHRARLTEFQSGEERFVWGRVKDGDELWFLEDNTAAEHREYVKTRLVCPVPGCSAPLTTVHHANKRDHLRHLVGTGGHAAESIFHSQGCALIESWLREKYPRSKIQREEDTNDAGERRADVLLTGLQGHRIAFEVQYSALTPEAWRRRHESYRSQTIIDVWLFGHSSRQLRLSRDGYLEPNPTHQAVVETGAALLFINPGREQNEIAVASGSDRLFDAELNSARGDSVRVLHQLDRAQLVVHALDDFRVNPHRGFTSDELEKLHMQSERLRAHNEAAKVQAAEILDRRRRQQAERQQRWEARRAPEQTHIRDLFDSPGRWSASQALNAIKTYFGPYLKGRIDVNTSPSAPPELLEQWQCVIYFDLIAGQTAAFGTRQAHQALQHRGVRLDSKTAFRDIARYLYRLCDEDFLRQRPGLTKYPSFQPTTSGAWW